MGAEDPYNKDGVRGNIVLTAGFPPVDGHANTVLVELPPDTTKKTGIIGTIIGTRYKVEEIIGQGGMGSVFSGYDTTLQAPVAIKVIHKELMCDDGNRIRFEEEARMMANIKNPHTVQVIDMGTTPDDRLYFVMEHVSGSTLGGELADSIKMQHKPFPWDRVKNILLQICDAMQAAHDEGIIHRDLKPENILLIKRKSRSDFVKVLDFGIAKRTSVDTNDNPNLTRTGVIYGTPAYLSPEQARGKTVDHRTDIYTLGVIMYELLTGCSPYDIDEDSDIIDIITAHATKPPVPPLKANTMADISTEVQAILFRALEKDPNKRFKSMDKMADAIGKAGPRFNPEIAVTQARLSLPELSGDATMAIEKKTHKLSKSVRWVLFGLLGLGAVITTPVMLHIMARKTQIKSSAPQSSSKSKFGKTHDAGRLAHSKLKKLDAGVDSAVDSSSSDVKQDISPDFRLVLDKILADIPKVKLDTVIMPDKRRKKSVRRKVKRKPKSTPDAKPAIQPASKPGELPVDPGV